MSQSKQLLNSLLWDIYGKQRREESRKGRSNYTTQSAKKDLRDLKMVQVLGGLNDPKQLEGLSLPKLSDVSAILKLEIRLMGYILERTLIEREQLMRNQEVLCHFMNAIVYILTDDAHPRIRFSLSPPPPKAHSVITSPTKGRITEGKMQSRTSIASGSRSENESPPDNVADDAASDYNQWLHAMKLVARLPGGMPPEFRRKLWLSLADKYLKMKNIDWSKQQEKCFCEKWREDDEELGIQIVKDLHRTGSNLCTGPAGSINQAKLKRILLGYARYNPEVGYCQGFNMLGALILQVMEKDEVESMKLMIYLVEGILPPGYFHGSMGGLQADMAVFRELMQTKLPRLAKHLNSLQKAQGPMENTYEPPLTNVFTMQWFLTLFCTCLPLPCVLRVWDLVLIEGSDVLLRTALVLWSLLEERVLRTRTADDFYCKMGSFSSELLNGHLIDSNGLIERVVQLGAIPDIQKLRDKHLYNIAPLRHKQGLQLYFDDEETAGSDEDSQLAVATVWGLPWTRRGSQDKTSTTKQVTENKERIALDISLLKKQYDRLRERQKQAHIILTTACSTARQGSISAGPTPNQNLNVNQLLAGRAPIMSTKGKRTGAPPGAIPPARKPSLPIVLHTTKPLDKKLRRGETLHWRDTDFSKSRRDSLTWKEIKADRATVLREGPTSMKSTKLRSRMGKSDSSSYSEESNGEEEKSSTDTSLCDDDDVGDKTQSSSIENSPKRKAKSSHSRKHKENVSTKLENLTVPRSSSKERQVRPKSWAASSNEVPFTLMTSESPGHSGDEKGDALKPYEEDEDGDRERESCLYSCATDYGWSDTKYSPIAGDLATTKLMPLQVQTDFIELPIITSTSQLSPMPDIAGFLNNSVISPLPTPKPIFLDSTNSLGSGDGDDARKFNVNDDGVINQYFECVNIVEETRKVELSFDLSGDDGFRNTLLETEGKPLEESETEKECTGSPIKLNEVIFTQEQKFHTAKDFIAGMEELLDSNIQAQNLEINLKSSITEGNSDFIELHSKNNESNNVINDSYTKTQSLSRKEALLKKRRDPRRLTLTRSTTLEIEERFQALEKRLSSEKVLGAEADPTTQATTAHIPTTVELETRFNNLEKQSSISNLDPVHSKNAKETKITDRSGPISEEEENSIKISTQLDNTLTCEYDKLHRSDPSETELASKDEKVSEATEETEKDFTIPSRQKRASVNILTEEDPFESQLKAELSILVRERPIGAEHPEPPRSTRDRDYEYKSSSKRLSIDLENHLESLEQQLSTKSSNTKQQVDLRNSEKASEDAKEHEKQSSKKGDQRAAENSEGKTDTKSNTVEDKTGNAEEKEPDKPRLTKLPSTAELEDRFYALERTMSVQKSSPKPTKKKPPDESEELRDVESLELDDKERRSARKAVEKNEGKKIAEERQEKVEDKKVKARENDRKSRHENDTQNETIQRTAEELDEKERDEKLSIKEVKQENYRRNVEKGKEVNKKHAVQIEKETVDVESKDDVDQSNEDAVNKKKAVPTTEELEKRFHALEKQLSTVNIKEKPSKQSENKASSDEKQKKSAEKFDDKCKEMAEKLTGAGEEYKERQKVTKTEDVSQQAEILKVNDLPKRLLQQRRASEPPTTEDLENRFETLTRRMSTKPIGISGRSETVEEALERIEKSVINESTTETEMQEDVISDDNLKEERKSDDDKCRKETKATKIISQQVSKAQPVSSDKKIHCLHKRETTQSSSSNGFRIPDAPPMPEKHEIHIAGNMNNQQHRALIEELQTKMKTQPNDENLKPSDINPTRKSPLRQRAATMFDETSEAPANTALYRSDNYEPWQTQPPRMVRRFSDLLSRADLENRLQFLERQLSKSFLKQRSASDSEVASKTQAKRKSDDEKPSTSQRQHSEEYLEKRVLELEKQLSEKSLKILEATRGECDREALRKLSIEANEAIGKELVKYTNVGELEEVDAGKPINISINIKMMVNKEVENTKRKIENLATAEDLEKRLDALEQKFKINTTVSTGQEEMQLNVKTDAKMEVVDTINNPRMNEQSQGNQKQGTDKSVASATENMVEDNNIEKQTKQIVKDNEKESSDTRSQNKTEAQSTLKPQENMPEALTKTQPNRTPVNTKDAASTVVKQVDKCKPVNKAQEQTNPVIPNLNGVSKIEKLSKETSSKEEPSKIKHAAKEVESGVLQKSNSESHKQQTILSQKPPEPPISTVDTKSKASIDITDNITIPDESTSNLIINTSEVGPVDPNKRTLVLLLDNEPKAMKVRRLTRANTEELEGLVEALEKQLRERNLIKTEDGKLKRADDKQDIENQSTTAEAKALSELTKEIEEYTATNEKACDKSETAEKKGEVTKPDKTTQSRNKAKEQKEEEKEVEFDWGSDPVKKHLKRKTAHLPSTKELEARFRSLERQIKLLEDVEKIDVEQRLNEIERKIKLQYALANEKDLSRYLELCEGKGLDDEETATTSATKHNAEKSESPYTSPARSKAKSPCTSPSRAGTRTPTTPTKSVKMQAQKSPYTSPKRTPTTPTKAIISPHTSPKRSKARSSYTSPGRKTKENADEDAYNDHENPYFIDLKCSKSKDNLRKLVDQKKQPIHPLEIMLDPTPDDSDIPTTGELEHRIRVLDEKCKTPSPARSSRSRSPPLTRTERQSRTLTRKWVTYDSPERHEPPTTDELEARMRALEAQQSFDPKTQRNFKEFNQKLKEVISPSVSFEEFRSISKSRESSPRRSDALRPTTPKSVLRESDFQSKRERSASPKVIRFQDEDDEYRPRSRTEETVGKHTDVLELIQENSKKLHRILEKTLAGSNSSITHSLAAAEGVDEMGSRLMRETSPLRRTGTHTGVPLRTDDNISDRLTSIKNTIKSIDTLCQETPYRKEKCQRYIDSLFSDSVHFAHKKASLEDLNRVDNRSGRDFAPSIRVSDHSQRPSEYYLNRSIGSAESLRSTSPLRAASPLHYRSNRDIRRDLSPRRRRDEEREEYESRVRRDNLLPNYFSDIQSVLDSGSLTKFHKVDSQLGTCKYDERNRDRDRSFSRSPSRSPLVSPYGSRETMTILHNTRAATLGTATTPTTTTTNIDRLDFERPSSPYRHPSHIIPGIESLKRTYTPVYSPSKLEIRHTTVTSTFYDRLLTEKQIEKSHTRPSNRSPVISPSMTTKSYLDATTTIGGSTTTTAKTLNEISPTAATMQLRSIYGTTPDLGLGSSYTSRTNYGCSVYGATNALTPTKTTTANTNTSTTITTTTTNYYCTNLTTTSCLATTTTTNTGNSNYYNNSLTTRSTFLTTNAAQIESHLRSCDNILTNLKSSTSSNFATGPPSVPTGTSSIATTTLSAFSSTTSLSYMTSTVNNSTANLYRPLTTTSFISILPSTLGNITTSATNPAATTTTSLYSTGVYNPIMPHTMRESSIAVAGNLMSSSYINSSQLNNNPTMDAGQSATELPRYSFK